MTRSRYLGLLLAAFMAGCAVIRGAGNGESDVSQGWAATEYAGETRQLEKMMADLPRLIALNAEDARREQDAAIAAFASDNSEVNRLRLAWLLSLDVGGKNDVTVLSLLDDANATPAPSASPSSAA